MRLGPQLLVVCTLALAIGALGRCDPPGNLTFPHEPTVPHSLRYACLGVVRYPYFVPPDKEPTDLNADAIARLNSTAITTLPSACQTSLLEMVCGSVYMQCDEAGNFDMYDEEVRPFLASRPMDLSFHFKRPCESLCTTAQSQCMGLLKLFAPNIDCAATRQWVPDDKLLPINAMLAATSLPVQTTIAPLFDARNNNTYCNAVENSIKQVGGTMEPYLGEVCRDFVQTTYIPPGQAVSLSPMQPAGIIQTAIEQQLAASFANLPLWVSYDCIFNLKRLFCTSSFMKPQPQSYGEQFAANTPPITELMLNMSGFSGRAIYEHKFFLPQYPHRDFCEEYNTACYEFMKLTENPKLQRNCDAEVDGKQSFPTTTQVLTSISTLVNGAIPLNMTFTTEPNQDTYQMDYTTLCPRGFSVPDDPNDEDNKWIEGTGCAANCASPVWGESEWKFILRLSEICSGIALMLGIVHLLWWTYDKVYKKRPLAYLMVVNVLLFTTPYTSKNFMNFQEAFCRDNVNGLDESDGFTFCYYSSLSIWYFGLVTVVNWLCVATDIYVRVVIGHKRPNMFLKFYIPCIYVLPLPIAIYAILHNHIGFDKIRTYCFVNDDGKGNIDLKLWYYPIAALCVIGALEMCAVYYKIWTVTGSAAKQDPASSGASNFARKLKPLFVPIKFVVFFLIVWLALFAVRVQVDVRHDIIYDNVHEWGVCIFTHFDGSNSWINICGETPKERVNPATGGFIMAATCSIGTITFFVFMVSAENFKRLSKALRPGKVHAVTGHSSFGASERVSDPKPSLALSAEGSGSGSGSLTAATDNALSPTNSST